MHTADDGWSLLGRALVGGIYLDPAEAPAYTPEFPAAARAAIEESLSQAERAVLELRFGLQDGRIRTLQEVAQETGWKRERIRSLLARALRKLRHPKFRLTKFVVVKGDAPW